METVTGLFDEYPQLKIRLLRFTNLGRPEGAFGRWRRIGSPLYFVETLPNGVERQGRN
jgi:hypothetical protein